VSPRVFEPVLFITATAAQGQFGPLQQRLLPVYFKLNTLISSGLLLAWIRNHSTVTPHLAYPTVPDVSQAYALFIVVASQALNLFWFGPATSKYVTWELHPPHRLTCSLDS